ncbi:hypothetical protein MUK42_22321 [Musa troglodytarum]|uniref:Uncharacterized protein n=1 Tax=Musa troglodytarum TaxID=320322 RepID=A0A9E7HWN4_9LILI|nr:hypothetical protein MUK42_22321 [Musa troglodytarum]
MVHMLVCYELEAEASEHYHPTRTVGASISIPRVELSSPLACPETSDLHLSAWEHWAVSVTQNIHKPFNSY